MNRLRDANMKYWIWVAAVIIWSRCSCSITTSTGAAAELEAAAAVSYWQKRLPGAGMPTSLRAMVSPLSSHEASQLLIDIQQLGSSYYLPTHAEQFCKAARIRCPHHHHQRSSLAQSATLERLELPRLDSGARPNHLPRLNKPICHPANLPFFLHYYHEEEGSEGSQSSAQDAPRRHEISSRTFFREHQVLVRGVDIHVNFAYGVDDTAQLERAFLPRKLAKLFPLAAGAGAVESIASKLGLSMQDEDLQGTMALCFANVDMHTDVDVKRCLSSMEDVADFVQSVMGDDESINIYDAIADAGTAELMKAGNNFHVVDVRMLKADRDEPAVACHDMPFPFRVFYCHYAKQTMIFQATLRSGEDGSVHERIAVCHYNTSCWTPGHMSFSDLNTKPGESEACHWLGGAWFNRKAWVFVRGAVAAIA